MTYAPLTGLLSRGDAPLCDLLTHFLQKHRGNPTLGALACELLRGDGGARLLPAGGGDVLATRVEAEGLADAGGPAAVAALLTHAVQTGEQLLPGPRPVTAALLLRTLVSLPEASGGPERRLQLLLGGAGIHGLPTVRAAAAVDPVYEPLGFGTDLTRLMQGCTTPPLIGRRDEVRQVLELLVSDRNVVLTGGPGVGKSALVEGLAWVLTHPTGDVPAELLSLQIVRVQVADLVADSGLQGALEKRLNAFLEHLRRNPNVVPFIDEIHALMAGGKASGQVIVDTLKPALARPGLRLIGATTDREYQRHFAADRALRERFRDVYLTEPSRAEAEALILGRGSGLFTDAVRRHGVGLTPEAVTEAVRLAAENFKESCLPRMPIELLREAAGAQAYKHSLAPDGPAPTVTAADVAAVVASRLGLAADALRGDLTARARQVRDALADAVVGQAAARSAILEGLSLGFAGVAEPGRPPAVFLFHGPRGTGKSTAAAALTGGGRSLFTLPMADFRGEGAASRLIGPGPGYRDSGETWTVFSAVRSRPASVVVLDGVEAVPADLVRPLGSILSGQASDGMGHPTDFSQCLFVLIAGPNLSGALSVGGDAQEALRRALGPALAGLIEQVVAFGPLSRDDGRTLLQRRLQRVLAAAPADGPVREVILRLSRPEALERLLDEAGANGGDGHAVMASLRSALRKGCWQQIDGELDK